SDAASCRCRRSSASRTAARGCTTAARARSRTPSPTRAPARATLRGSTSASSARSSPTYARSEGLTETSRVDALHSWVLVAKLGQSAARDGEPGGARASGGNRHEVRAPLARASCPLPRVRGTAITTGRRGGGSPRAELTERGPTSGRGGRTVVRSRVAARFGGARSLARSDARTRRAFGAASGNAAEWRTPTPPATSDAPFVPDEGFFVRPRAHWARPSPRRGS